MFIFLWGTILARYSPCFGWVKNANTSTFVEIFWKTFKVFVGVSQIPNHNSERFAVIYPPVSKGHEHGSWNFRKFIPTNGHSRCLPICRKEWQSKKCYLAICASFLSGEVSKQIGTPSYFSGSMWQQRPRYPNTSWEGVLCIFGIVGLYQGRTSCFSLPRGLTIIRSILAWQSSSLFHVDYISEDNITLLHRAYKLKPIMEIFEDNITLVLWDSLPSRCDIFFETEVVANYRHFSSDVFPWGLCCTSQESQICPFVSFRVYGCFQK